MNYFITDKNNKEFFVLFHGTGGNEYSLLSVSGDLNPEAGVISFLGNSGTGTTRRFFNPLIEGTLDRADFNQNVATFLDTWTEIKPQNAKLTFIGYSNGANFLLGILEKAPEIADKIILMHPANLGYSFKEQTNTPILLTYGANDYMVPPGDVLALANQMKPFFPKLEAKLLDSGHEVTDLEVKTIKNFLNQH
ncbi:alpha/beta hydrolase [Carnobacterium sp.]|uniref:alpha/beta hydrolase n=1 Tax=Carnobacterium sp. TaxID=48221 RepID=UPI002FC72C42